MVRLVVLVVLALPVAAWAQPANRELDPEAIDRAAERVLTGRYQGEPDEMRRRRDEEAERRWREQRERAEREARERGEDMERWERERREREEREEAERERGGGGDADRYHRRRGGRGGEGSRRRGRGQEDLDDGGDVDIGGGGGGGAVSSIVTFILYGALIVALLFLVMFIVREVMRRKGDAEPEPEEVEAKEEAVEEEDAPKAELVVPLDEAELLARDGRYAEAIHLLLLRTFQELARAADVRIASSLTSREILAKIPLRPGARDALAELVDVVENTWFGDDVPGEVQWQRCRQQFDRFVAIYRAAAPSLLEAA